MQVLPTQLLPDDEDAKVLRVKMIQKEGCALFDPVHLFDEGSTISWIPCGRKLACSFPGIKFNYGPDDWCAPSLRPVFRRCVAGRTCSVSLALDFLALAAAPCI